MRDVRERPEHGRAVRPARPGDVERLAKDSLGVVELPAPGERLAQLAAEDEHRAHRIVELAPEELAPRELERRAAGP